jgi:WD40 repeat protein
MIRKIVIAFFSIAISTFALAQRVTLSIPNTHAKHIEQVATTSDGKYIASISFKTVMIWDVASRKKIHEISLNVSNTESKNSTLAVTDQLDKVLVAANSGLYCYNIQTGKEIFTKGNAFGGATFSEDETKVYLVDNGVLYILDAATGKEIKYITRVVDNSTSDAKFYELGDNRLLILHHYGWSIINIVTDEIVFKKTFGNIYSEKLDGYYYSKNDNVIVGFREEYLISFNLLTGATLQKKSLTSIPSGLCIDQKGELVLFSRDYSAKKYITELLKTSDFSVIKTTSQPDSEVPEAIFYAKHCVPLPGTNKIIYDNNQQLFLYDIREGNYSNAFQNKITDFKFLYFLPDNSLTFSTEDNGIRQFNMETFKPDSFIPASAGDVMSSDGKLAAGIGQEITLTNLTTGKLIKTLPLPAAIDPETDFELELFFFNFDNTKLIYTEWRKGSINSIDINTGKSSKIVTLGTFIRAESASFDGKYFACITFDNKVSDKRDLKVYNLQTNKVVVNTNACVSKTQEGCIGGLGFLNDSYYLFAIMESSAIKIYKADDRDYLSSFELEHLNQLTVLGGDIKNNIIVIGEGTPISNHTIRLVTLQGKVLKTFSSLNNNDFLKAAFSKDDKIMFTPTIEKGVQVWNTESGELLGTYYFIEDKNEYIFVSPDGLFDGSVEGMKELYFVKNNKPIPLEKLYEQFYTPDLLRRKINGENFLPPDVANLRDAPIVSIAYAAIQRNLEVADDIPAYQNTSGKAEITVTANAADDVVDEIRLFHNGKVMQLLTRNLIVEDDKTKKAVKKYTINLLPGQNNIRAVALNTQRTESDPAEITVIYNAGSNINIDVKPVINNAAGTPVDAIDKTATMYLVVVGINHYENKKMSLNYALADAAAFKDEVEKDSKSVIGTVKTYFVTDAAANKAGITNAFMEVQQNAKAQDVFIFYYAGHGVIGSEKEFYLVPTDVSDLKNVQSELEAKGIPAKLLQQYAIDIAAQKQLFILDACQSAGAFNEMLSADGDQQKSIAVVSRSTGTHWMAASGAQQYANEFSQLGHGAFTYVLLEALKGSAATDKMITVNGLKNYLQQGVPELMKKYSGTLQYPASYGFGNDFPVEVLK